MKKLIWLFTAILPLAFVFSCQKQIAADDSATGGRNPEMLANCKAPPAGFVTYTTNPAVPVAGQPLTVFVTVACGGMTEMSILLNGTAIATSSGGGTVQTRQVTFTPSGANCTTNTYTISMKYNSAGGGKACDTAPFNDGPYCASNVELQASTICIPVSNTPPACNPSAPLTLFGQVTNVVTAGGLSTISVEYTVTSCVNLTGVRVQGGATAGGDLGVDFDTYIFSDPGLATTGYPKELNKNLVLSWTTDLSAGVSKKFTFTYTRSAITNCLTSVTGGWSATAAGVTTANAAQLQWCP